MSGASRFEPLPSTHKLTLAELPACNHGTSEAIGASTTGLPPNAHTTPSYWPAPRDRTADALERIAAALEEMNRVKAGGWPEHNHAFARLCTCTRGSPSGVSVCTCGAF